MNAKEELIEDLEGKKIKCASITHEPYGVEKKKIILKANYTNKELNHFLSLLNFEYDGGFGTQELYGVVWIEDGTWLSRKQYNGLEWWYLMKPNNEIPEISSDLL
jgi:hypothetical protein